MITPASLDGYPVYHRLFPHYVNGRVPRLDVLRVLLKKEAARHGRLYPTMCRKRQRMY